MAITTSDFYKNLQKLDDSRTKAIQQIKGLGISSYSEDSIPDILNKLGLVYTKGQEDILLQPRDKNVSIITAEGPNINITLYDGDSIIETKSSSSVGGIVIFNFEFSESKLYTLKGFSADDANTAIWETSVQIDSAGEYKVPSGKPLNDYTWDEIKYAANNGYAKYMFNIWDYKDMISGSSAYKVRIIGFDHDDKSDGSGKAGITFYMYCYSSIKHWSSSTTNINGISWIGSNIRKECLESGKDMYVYDPSLTSSSEGTFYIFDSENNTFIEKTLPDDWNPDIKFYKKETTTENGRFYGMFSSDITENIVSVKKKTWGGYGGVVKNSSTAKADNTIITTNDKLWILADGEVFGNSNRRSTDYLGKYELEGRQYEAFKDYNEERYRPSSSQWLRSPCQGYSYNFQYWYNSGYDAYSDAYNADYPALCFCF